MCVEPSWWQEMKRKALESRKAMVRDGELLSAMEFGGYLHLSPGRLARLELAGSVFSVEVDGVAYYPALLADARHDRRRLRAICRILQPAEAWARLGFLESRRGSLGDISPLDAMRSDAGYRRLREVARGWAAEWSRTIIKIYAGEYLSHDAELPLVCEGAVEADPRVDFWRRAAEALQPGGNLRPDGPYPVSTAITAFVVRATAGGPQDIPEARLEIVVRRGTAHCSVLSHGPQLELEPVAVPRTDDVVTVVRKVVASMLRSSGDENAGNENGGACTNEET